MESLFNVYKKNRMREKGYSWNRSWNADSASTNMTNNISTDLTNSASLNSDDGKKKIKNELL